MAGGGDNKKGKVGGIRSTTTTQSVEKTTAVGDVEKVEKAKAVTSVRGAGAVGKAGRVGTLTLAQRQVLFQMIDEESEKLFGKSNLPLEHRKIVETAVKMAVDTALVDDDAEKEGKKKE